ncbi:MAG: hypothetical protein ACI8TP_001371 [Acidimicrobiales bacterium]|jgi:hypothetical protein
MSCQIVVLQRSSDPTEVGPVHYQRSTNTVHGAVDLRNRWSEVRFAQPDVELPALTGGIPKSRYEAIGK